MAMLMNDFDVSVDPRVPLKFSVVRLCSILSSRWCPQGRFCQASESVVLTYVWSSGAAPCCSGPSDSGSAHHRPLHIVLQAAQMGPHRTPGAFDILVAQGTDDLAVFVVIFLLAVQGTV